MTALNWGLVREFVVSCSAAHIEPPQVVVSALRQLDVANTFVTDPVGGPVLGLTDLELRERITDLSIRAHNAGNHRGAGLRPGHDVVSDALAHEVREAVVVELDGLIESLQSRFSEAAKPLERAALEFGIEAEMSTDEVLERDDFEEAGAAWRAMRSGWFKLAPLTHLRIVICRTFNLSPNLEDIRRAGHNLQGDEGGINYSVCFSGGEGWSLDPDRFHVQGDRRRQVDWFALAKSGGLRLNTISEVAAKIEKRGVENVASSPTFRDIDVDIDDLDDASASNYMYPTSRKK